MGEKLIIFVGGLAVMLAIGFVASLPTLIIVALVVAVCAWMIWFDQKKTAERTERDAEQARQSNIDSET